MAEPDMRTPHVLSLEVVAHPQAGGGKRWFEMQWKVECPYPADSTDKPCAVHWENTAPAPLEPDETVVPRVRYRDGAWRLEDSDELAPEDNPWMVWMAAADEYEPWIPGKECWVQESANNTEVWDPNEGGLVLTDTAGAFTIGRMNVDWVNRGEYDESALELIVLGQTEPGEPDVTVETAATPSP